MSSWCLLGDLVDISNVLLARFYVLFDSLKSKLYISFVQRGLRDSGWTCINVEEMLVVRRLPVRYVTQTICVILGPVQHPLSVPLVVNRCGATWPLHCNFQRKRAACRAGRAKTKNEDDCRKLFGVF